MAIAVALLAVSVAGCSMFGADKPSAVASLNPADGAPAEQPKKRTPPAMRLARYDTNGDGQVSKAELDAGLKADFAKEDVNHNGVLDTSEARALNDRLREEENTSPVFDWNGDGQLVYEEFASQWRTLFDRADRNQDGILDATELGSAGREHKPRELPKPGFGSYTGS
jgi:Ca2+-binding EF-hand superfamily protein